MMVVTTWLFRSSASVTALRIRHEAEHRHRYHEVEGGILERQLLGAALLEGHFDSAGSGACLGSVKHLPLEVERRDDGTALSSLDGVGAVSGTDVEHTLAPQRPREVEDDARLHPLGDLAEGCRSPLSVGLGSNDGLGHEAHSCIQGFAR